VRRAFPPLVLVLGSVLVSLAAAEIALRVLGFSHASFWIPDKLTGSRLRPAAEGWSGREGGAHVKINSRGLRDREHEIPKPAGVYRIAVLGDSYAEALSVSVEQTFWWRLAQQLQSCAFASGRRVETVNFGVSGYGTADELLTLRHRAWEYSPDLVLLAFFPGNDVRNNSKRLELERRRPFFIVREGALALDASFTADPVFVESQRVAAKRASLQGLRLYQLLRKVKAPIAAAFAQAKDRAGPLGEPGLDENVLREPADAAWQDAWEVTERLLLEMRDEVRSRGARFVVAVLSNPGAVHPDAEARQRHAEFLRVPDLLYPDRRVREFSERNAIEVILLAPDMQRHADATGAYLHGFENTRLGVGHWNEAGHAFAARLIAARLCPA
jgi:hypothetical protein